MNHHSICLTKKITVPPFQIDFWSKPAKHSLSQIRQGHLKLSRAKLSREEEMKQSYGTLRSFYTGFNVGFLNQAHGDKYIFIDHTNNKQKKDIFWENAKEADAAFSYESKTILCVRSADCIPIVFYESKSHNFFGVVHAGWRGLQNNILSKTIHSVCNVCITQSNLKNSQKSNNIGSWKFWIGPHIGANSYEVGEDVFSLFPDGASSSIYIKNSIKKGPKDQKEDKKMLDMKSILQHQMQQLGVQPDQISWDDRDTYSTPTLYSHRRGELGRNITVIYKLGSK